jgi:uncharacterized damage-inducible protein DinB
MEHLKREFIAQSISHLDEYTSKIEKCLMDIKDGEFWERPNESSNSIGNIILHLCGNITQYIISSLGNTEDKRNRDEEFNAAGGYTKTELSQKLSNVVFQAKNIIRDLDVDDLLRVRSVQGFKLTGLGIILHVVEHYSYHTGQIAFWVKLLRNKDLGFYKDQDLNIKNIPD